MEKCGRADLIAQVAGVASQVAGLASQVNKLLAMLLAETGAGDKQAPASIPAAPAKSGRKSGVNTQREEMRIAEAAAFTGYSQGHLHRLVANGELPRRGRVRGRLFFKRSELEELMLRKNKRANSEIADMATAILNGEAV